MSTAFSVDALKIASPCPASWDAMAGDDRSRFCSQCEKQVYNIASMTGDQVLDLVRQTEGDFCGRLYRRRDGKVLTADCPVGRGEAPKRLLRRLAACGVIGIGMVTTGAVLRASSRGQWQWPPSGPNVGLSDYWDWAMYTMGWGDQSVGEIRLTAGAIRCPPPPASGASSPPAVNSPDGAIMGEISVPPLAPVERPN